MIKKAVLFFSLLSLISFTPFEKEAPESKKGRESYAAGDFESAEKEFSKAAGRLEKNGEAHYNSGNAKFKKGDVEGALLEYGRALEATPDDRELRSKIFHNMGNIFAQMGKLNESEKLFIRSLIEKPTEDTAANLEIVRRLIELQEEEEREDQDSCDQGDESEEKDQEEEKDSREKDSGEEEDKPDDSQEMEEEEKDEEESTALPENKEDEKEEEEVDSTILQQFNQRKNLQISPFMLKKDGRSESGQTW